MSGEVTRIVERTTCVSLLRNPDKIEDGQCRHWDSRMYPVARRAPEMSGRGLPADMETASAWVNPLDTRQGRMAADVFERSGLATFIRPRYVGADLQATRCAGFLSENLEINDSRPDQAGVLRCIPYVSGRQDRGFVGYRARRVETQQGTMIEFAFGSVK